MSDDFLIPPADTDPDANARVDRGHNAMVSLFGREFLPESVMRIKRGLADAERDGPAASRRYEDSLSESHKQGKANKKLPFDLRYMYHSSGRGSLNGALSKFPQEIGRTVLLFYSDPGCVVVDPFAGHNSRMSLCVETGRDYVGCDLSADFMLFNRKKAKQLIIEHPNCKVELHHCDSRSQPIPDATGDFCITSPPYYDIEEYGDEPEQLGKSETYAEFLDGMQSVVNENYRTLKPGAYSCWFVNDFRRNGVMHFYHSDIIQMGERSGFVPWDILIVDLGRCMRDCFINQAVSLKILPKRHEYCVVFRKPGA